MTMQESNELLQILRESLSYFKHQGFIVESAEEKMYYYIRDRINLRLTPTTSWSPLGFDDSEITGRPELIDM